MLSAGMRLWKSDKEVRAASVDLCKEKVQSNSNLPKRTSIIDENSPLLQEAVSNPKKNLGFLAFKHFPGIPAQVPKSNNLAHHLHS